MELHQVEELWAEAGESAWSVVDGRSTRRMELLWCAEGLTGSGVNHRMMAFLWVQLDKQDDNGEAASNSQSADQTCPQ